MRGCIAPFFNFKDMEAKELRLGNLVYDTEGKENNISLEALTFLSKEPINQVRPIPLTEDWLLKFGFVHDKTHDNYYIGYNPCSVKFDNGEGGWFFSNDISSASWYIFTLFHYVHQLQNLYFALTGEELTLNQ